MVKTKTRPDGTAIDTTGISLIGLRDRALIALMVFSLARVGAALGMKVEDVYTQNRRLWVRLKEKGGKAHAMPCHHSLEEYLHAYIDGAGLMTDPKGPLFPTIGRGTDRLTATPMSQADAHAMIRRRASPITSKTEARWRQPPRWQIMPARAPPSSTTAGRIP